MARQATLERMGWRFVRVRGSCFFRGPQQAMKPVFSRLSALGIEPTASEVVEEQQVDATAAELREWIIRRAEELRWEWAPPSQEADAAAEEPGGEVATAEGPEPVSPRPSAARAQSLPLGDQLHPSTWADNQRTYRRCLHDDLPGWPS